VSRWGKGEAKGLLESTVWVESRMADLSSTTRNILKVFFSPLFYNGLRLVV